MFKKGQVETIGLVVIVLLITFVGLLFLIFTRSDLETEDEFLSIKANNFLNSLKLVSGGASNFESFAIECCNGNQGSCNSAENIFIDSLEYIDHNVNFELTCISGSKIEFIDAECDFGVTSETVILSSSDKISLKLCRN